MNDHKSAPQSNPTDTTEPTLKSHYPCNVCGEVAIACLRPDIDIKGLCFCAEHEDEVRTVYWAIGSLEPKLIESMMKDWKFK